MRNRVEHRIFGIEWFIHFLIYYEYGGFIFWSTTLHFTDFDWCSYLMYMIQMVFGSMIGTFVYVMQVSHSGVVFDQPFHSGKSRFEPCLWIGIQILLPKKFDQQSRLHIHSLQWLNTERCSLYCFIVSSEHYFEIFMFPFQSQFLRTTCN